MANPINVNIAVIGAGPVGGILACRLANAAHSVLLVDRAAPPHMERSGFDGRVYAVATGSRPLLEEAGLWQRLPFEPCPIDHIGISEGKLPHSKTSILLHFDHRQAADNPFGWIIEAGSIRLALNSALKDSSRIVLRAPAQANVERYTDRALIKFAGGETYSARLVIAADGRTSTLRASAKIPVTRLAYRQTALVCAIAHERPHNNVALQLFFPGGPTAQLPMTGTAEAIHLSGIVLTESHDVADQLTRMEITRFNREVGRRLGDHLGGVRLIGQRWSYRLSALHAHRYFAPRLALVGDSAHTVHPIAGQGLNLGLRDAATLAELIDANDDPGSLRLLAAYQTARRPDNLLMLAATDSLNRLFSNNLQPVRVARDLGLAAVERMPWLKHLFMRTAMGLNA